ncbi:MAG: hypothetical protein ACOX4Q_00405 [Syntrophomonadales bacterium]
MADKLVFKDRVNIVEITYEDMIKYHGRFHIAGVAMAYKVLELAFSVLFNEGEIPSRREVRFLTGIGMNGTGVIDAVEMATRAWTGGRLTADCDVVKDKLAPDAPNGGKYYFEVGYDSRRIEVSLKDGLIPDEFIVLSRKAHMGNISQDEIVRLQRIKEQIASFIMSTDAKDLFDYTIRK